MIKSIILISFIALCTTTIICQDFSLSNEILKKCSPETAILLSSLKNEKSFNSDTDDFQFLNINERDYIDAFIVRNQGFDFAELVEQGVILNTTIDNLTTSLIPLDKLSDVIQNHGIKYVEIGKKVNPKLDVALQESKVNLVHNANQLSKKYTGKGIIVGVIDRGFDYTHPTFFNAEGSEYRIKSVFEITSDGIAPDGFEYGHEMTSQDEIIARGTDSRNFNHGTRVAGIAAGSGGALQNQYKGVAYESEMVFVSVGKVFDNLDMTNTFIIDGINYIFQYAESVSKPAVINMSLGHHRGPHDGTSITDQFIDKLSGPGKIIVGAAGNEGGNKYFLHLFHEFGSDPETVATFLLAPDDLSSDLFISDFWGEENTDFSIALNIYNPHSDRIEAKTKFYSTTESQLIQRTFKDDEGHRIPYKIFTNRDPVNNRPHIRILCDNNSQIDNDDVDFINLQNNDFVLVEIKTEQSTAIHGWAANNYEDAIFSDLGGIGVSSKINDVNLIDGDNLHTTGELGGTAKEIISVGAYISNNAFENINGRQLDFSEGYKLQEKETSSSIGPTIDGRIKPDIMAPGSIILTSFSSFNSNTDEKFYAASLLNINNQEAYFGPAEGTSMASPLVAGIVALMLEANPTLTPQQVKTLIQETATEDEFTEAVPNNLWGYGKINAHKILQKLDSGDAIELPKPVIMPNPTDGSFSITSEIDHKQVIVFDVVGRIVLQTSINSENIENEQFDFTHLESGIYFIKLSNDEVSQTAKLILHK